MSKNNVVKSQNSKKHFMKVITQTISTDNETPLWSFSSVDTDGGFCFSSERIDHKLVIEKLTSLSKCTWQEIKTATHDKGKSKNHPLDFNGISPQGQKRIKVKNLMDDADSIFSIALTNVVRLIGLKKGRIFHIIWYDANHGFYHSTK